MRDGNKCGWCGLIHGPRCPSVKAIEYYEDGVTVKRVEFVTAADYVFTQPPLPISSPWVTPWWGPPTTWSTSCH